MGKRFSPWPIRAVLLLCLISTLCISSPRVAEAAERDESTGTSPSPKASLPKELKIIDLEKNINAVDLRGVGRDDDVVIKFDQHTGVVTAPTDYIFLTKANNDPSSELLSVPVPDVYSRKEDLTTFDSEDMDCVLVVSRLAHSPDNRTFIIRVVRDLPHGLSPIRLELLQLVEDAYTTELLDGGSTAYEFSRIELRNLKSSACTYDEVMSLAAKTFHVKLTR